jgi:peptide/nickel transport system substrate-binding protein
MQFAKRLPACALAGAAALALSACGNSSSSTSGNVGEKGLPVPGQQKGGTLKVLSNESFQHLDPGQAYFQLDYEVLSAAQRQLYSYRPDNSKKPVPDLAVGDPKISNGGRTVTVKIRQGIRYSPGTVSRPVEAKDFKYAFERAFSPAVPNGYAPAYFGDIVGADKAKGGPIAGIQTPNPSTLVLNLSKPSGALVAQALVLPISAPVPEEYAKPLDAKTPSRYDADPTKQAFTGPYVFKSYDAGKSLVMTRNANWSAATDFRPAYADRIEWTIGVDPNVAGRQILTGKGLVSGDTPPAPIIKLAATKHAKQVFFTAYGNRYITLNTQRKPFSDVNVRRAVNAVIDKQALRQTRGGPLVGDLGTHVIPPTTPGFDEAGGAKGPGFDFVSKPAGDKQLAAGYLKKAGFKDGKYSGPPITVYGDNEDPASKTAQVIVSELKSLGFGVKFRSFEHSVFLTKCTDTSALRQIDICANYGWLPDFADGQSMLDPTFNGSAITAAPTNNNNGSLLNDPKINAAMARAALITDPAQRAKAWGDIDRSITETAAVVPWLWDKQANVVSSNVQGVIAQWNAAVDLTFTSLKRGA